MTATERQERAIRAAARTSTARDIGIRHHAETAVKLALREAESAERDHATAHPITRQNQGARHAMITHPQRCIWMRPVSSENLEIILLGNANPDENTPEAENVAAIFVHVRKLAEAWPGWDRVDVLTMGASVVGLRCNLAGKHSPADLLAEGVRMFANSKALRWTGGSAGANPALGMLATW